MQEKAKPSALKLPSFGTGPLLDLSDYLAKVGVPLSPGAVALYSPIAQSIFIRDTPGQLATYEEMFAPVCLLQHYPLHLLQCRLEILDQSRPTPATLFSAKFPCKSGQRCQIAWGTLEEDSFEMEPVLGPDERSLECNIVLKFKHGEAPFSFAGPTQLVVGQTGSLFELATKSTVGKAVRVAARITITADRYEPQTVEAMLHRNQMIAKIEAELAAQIRGRQPSR